MEKMYKRVILIGVDGAGTFFRQADTPCMDRIFANGSTTYNALTSLPTISAECWGSMLHGIAPEYHRLTNGIVCGNKYDVDSPYPSVFRLIRKRYPHANLASFCCWDPINYGIIEHNLNVYMDSCGDTPMTGRICEYIQKNDFDTIFVQFDTVDGAGHQNGYGSQKHLERITLIDSFIGRIYDTIVERGFEKDTLFMVTADHGGTPQGGHGGDTKAEKIIFIGATGYNVIPGTMGTDGIVSVRDIAGILLTAMGIEIPENWDSQVPSGLFKDYDAKPARKSEAKVFNPEVRKKSTIPPDAGELKSLIEKGGLRDCFTFNGKPEDLSGRTEPVAVGNLKYVDGKFGKAGYFRDGHVKVGRYKIGADSFSVGLWMNVQNIDPVENSLSFVLCNKNVYDLSGPGFALAVTQTQVEFFVGTDKNAMQCFQFAYPENYKEGDGWFHFVFTYDRETERGTGYFDFDLYHSYLIYGDVLHANMDALDLFIGIDSQEKWSTLDASLEDVLIFDHALSLDEVRNLGKIYKSK